MSLTEELQKLEALYRNGTLTESEFVQAKAALLAQFSPTDAANQFVAQLAEVRYQNELARIDREWELERARYAVNHRNGDWDIPTVTGTLAGAIWSVLFGVFFTVATLSSPRSGTNHGPYRLADLAFSLVGVGLIAYGIWHGVWGVRNVRAYTRSHAAYQRRRAAVKPEDFR